MNDIARCVGLLRAEAARASKTSPTRKDVFETYFVVGDHFLVGRGEALCQMKWTPMRSKLWGPCTVTAADHTRYKRESPHGGVIRRRMCGRWLVCYHNPPQHLLLG